MKLRDLFVVEFKIAGQPDPKDREDYKAKMASLQDIQKDPKMADARTQAVIAKRKEELRRWAEKNLRTEDNVQERMPASVIKSKQRYADMTDQELADRFKDSDEKTLRQMAWRHGYGNMSSHYFDRVQKGKSQTEDGVQPTDMKRMGAETKTLYVHKDGKTIMIPAEREKDFIQKGFKRSALRTEETNEGEMRLDKSAFVQMLADKIKEPQKGHGRPEYDNRLLAKMYKLITGKDVDFEGNKFTITMNKPTTEGTYLDEGWLDTLKAAGRKIVPDQVRALYDPATAAKVQADDQAKVQMDTLFKDINTVAGLNQTDVSQGYPADLVVAYLRKYVAPRHPDAFKRMDAQGDLKKMFPAGQKISSGTLKGNLNKVAVELGKVNLSPDQGQQPTQQPTQQPQLVPASMDNEETVSEEAPFGSGMDLVRMAVMRKFISAEEYTAYAKELKAAGEEVEQEYDDWPDGEGFGSSDGNFAIKDLMGKAGYEFDEQDKGGRFIVTKMPEKLEKMGIKNVRMKDAVATEDSVKEGASMIPYFKTEKDFDGEKTTVYEFPMAWAKDKELDTPYLSNASMRQFLMDLGYGGDFENMSAVPVEEFIAVTTQWLQKNIDKKSPEEPTTIDKNPDGPTMISGGKPEGYMNRQVKLHNELARKIKQKYPEVTHLGFN